MNFYDENLCEDDQPLCDLFQSNIIEISELEDEVIIKYDQYKKKSKTKPDILTLALVAKHHSLWAEYIYNAARVLSEKIDCNEISCKNKKCLELGAGAGLPGQLYL
jgi:predicted nicotinamide N-methyase